MKVFLDTNILISGIFFSGNEAKLLQIPEIEFVTSQTVVEELKSVVKNKFISLKIESLKLAIDEVDKAMKDIQIVQDINCSKYISEAKKMVEEINDQKILSAVLASKPDYFITGDRHFYSKKVKTKVKIKKTREILKELKII